MFGKRLRLLRKKHNKSQLNIADAIGVTQSGVSQWESGTRFPDIESLRKIADIFEVTTDYLLGRTDDPKARIIRLSDLGEGISGGYIEVITEAAKANLSASELQAIVNIIKRVRQK